MGHGKSIRIYLADGSAKGIRHAEVVNWTGQAIVCPRSRVGELSRWDESKRPGVYLLVGEDPKRTRPLIYVGEAENVYTRLRTHLNDKKMEFFDEVVFFSSKDANLTKSHVKYLESRMIAIAAAVDRVTLHNGNAPNLPSLPRSERDAMEEYLDPARLLLSALGFTALQPLTRTAGLDASGPSGPLADVLLRFSVKKRRVDATGLSTDEGFVVREGSIGASALLDTLSKGYRSIRDDLLASGDAVDDGTRVRFTRDVLFKSPTAAACVLAAAARNGRRCWKDGQGRTLTELEGALNDAAGERGG